VAVTRAREQGFLVIGDISGYTSFLTSTELDGHIVLRTCIVNFRTTPADLDRVLNAVAAAGQSLLSQPTAG